MCDAPRYDKIIMFQAADKVPGDPSGNHVFFMVTEHFLPKRLLIYRTHLEVIHSVNYRESEPAYVRYLQGDDDAFDEIAKQYFPLLIRFIEQLVRSVPDAEDLAADTLLELLIRRERYRFQSSLKTYLFAIAKNKAYNFFRKQTRLEPLDSALLPCEESLPEDLTLERELMDTLRLQVGRMKRDYQAALYLTAVEEMSYEEAAKVMRKSPGQMRNLVFHARQKLRSLMKEGEECERNRN